jgi:hypothetical protein
MLASVLVALLPLQGGDVRPAGGTITGRIVSLDGKPVAGLRVMALAVEDSPPQSGSAILSIAQTDAAGNYRLEKVAPGRYYITAGLVDLPSYYPGVGNRTDARVVNITGGALVQGIDFTQVIPSAVKLSGRVVRSNSGSPATGSGSQVLLTSTTGTALTTNIASDGTFQFPSVRPGKYSAMVRPGMTMQPVTIVIEDKDVAGIEIAVPASKEVAGRVAIEGGGPIPRMAFYVGATAFGLGSIVMASPQSDGTFRIVLPEAENSIELITSSIPTGYSIKALSYGTADLLKEPLRLASSGSGELQVTLVSPKVPRVKVSGRVAGAEPGLTGALVTLSSTAIVEIRNVPIGADGTFEIPEVFPGTYSVRASVPGTNPISITVRNDDVKNVEIAVPERVEISAASIDPEKVIGSLSWIITEAATGKIVDRGDGPVRLKDVTISEVPNPSRRQTPKTIRLNNQFTLVMAEFPRNSASELDGFGMVASKTDIPSFSWEWFNVDNPAHATKILETGSLGINISKIGGSWEVTRTEFLSDVSMRIIRMNVDPPGSPPYWRVQILKGSSITWPSLVNGRVVAN